MKRFNIIVIILVLLFFAIGFYFYPQLPAKIATHWNSKGNVNGYMPKAMGLFFLPVIVVGVSILFLIIPKIDPLKSNIKKFIKAYYSFVIVFIAFMMFVYIQMISWNLGFKVNPISFIGIPVGLLYIAIAYLIKSAKRNWFVGIRTPWTLSSDYVWEKTHALGSKLFIVAGIFSIAGVFFIDYTYAILFIIAPIVAFSLFLVFYSYFVYSNEKKHKMEKV